MYLLPGALRVARAEAGLLRAYPRVWLSILGIVLIPALYAFIYLQSVWDPASRTGLLQAVVVNLDQGTEVGDQKINLGDDLVRTLQARKLFDFRADTDPDHAREQVRQGHTLFALIVPADFSATAMRASTPGAGKVTVFASEGNNYAGAGFARRFANELAYQVNETLNERRWELVLGRAAESADSLARMREAVARLHQGAGAVDAAVQRAQGASTQIAGGALRLSENVTALTDGVRQLDSAVRALDARKPAPAQLQALKTGAEQLAEGHLSLAKAFPPLEGGARQLAQGGTQLREELRNIPFLGNAVTGAGQLAEGGQQLGAGLKEAREAQQRLTSGAQALAEGVNQAVDGFGAYAGAVSSLASRMPHDPQLESLAEGGRTVADGTRRLQSGLTELRAGSSQLAVGVAAVQSALPEGIPQVPGTSPRGLAHSVDPIFEIDAPVNTNGMGFIPNFIPVALWMGAVMTAFIFNLRRVPQRLAGESQYARILGKLAVLVPINLLQASCVFAMSALLLGLQPVHAAGLALTMVVSVATFMLVIFLLLTALGDIGKALAVILVILQLSAAGGIVPIELTNDFFASISNWMPFTWSIRAVRASAFDAFGGQWASALGVLSLFGLAAFVLACFTARWRVVADADHRPALDI